MERVITPVRTGFLGISPLEIVAAAATISLLVVLNEKSTAAGVSILVPSFAASIAVLYAEAGMSVAKSWNVIVGQMMGALAGILCVSVLSSPTWLAAGIAVGLALILQRTTHSLHPPGVATGLFVVLTPDHLGWLFLLRPMLAGAVTIVVIAWAIHVLEGWLSERLRSRS